MSETRILGDVLSALKGLAGGKFWRNNTGAAWLPGAKRPVKFGEPGSADILGCFLGRGVAIECKTAQGRLSPVQKLWRAAFEAAGGLYIVARCVADALTGLGVGPNHPSRLERARIIHR